MLKIYINATTPMKHFCFSLISSWEYLLHFLDYFKIKINKNKWWWDFSQVNLHLIIYCFISFCFNLISYKCVMVMCFLDGIQDLSVSPNTVLVLTRISKISFLIHKENFATILIQIYSRCKKNLSRRITLHKHESY